MRAEHGQWRWAGYQRQDQGVLRWALLKAIILLRLHRDALDAVAEGMTEGKPVVELLECIEAAAVDG